MDYLQHAADRMVCDGLFAAAIVTAVTRRGCARHLSNYEGNEAWRNSWT